MEPTVITQRPSDSFEALCRDYFTMSEVRAPGLLHAIARFPGDPTVFAKAAAFLAKVGNEQEIFEPNEDLRSQAVHLMVRFPMKRWLDSDPECLLLIVTMVRFFAVHPRHFYRCRCYQGDAEVVQQFLTTCWNSFVARQDPSVKHSWMVPDAVLVDALINCQVARPLCAMSASIPRLYDRVVTGVLTGSIERLGQKGWEWRDAFTDDQFGIGPKSSAPQAIASRFFTLGQLCALAKRVGDDQLRWEAKTLIDAVQHFIDRSLESGPPTVKVRS